MKDGVNLSKFIEHYQKDIIKIDRDGKSGFIRLTLTSGEFFDFTNCDEGDFYTALNIVDIESDPEKGLIKFITASGHIYSLIGCDKEVQEKLFAVLNPDKKSEVKSSLFTPQPKQKEADVIADKDASGKGTFCGFKRGFLK